MVARVTALTLVSVDCVALGDNSVGIDWEGCAERGSLSFSACRHGSGRSLREAATIQRARGLPIVL